MENKNINREIEVLAYELWEKGGHAPGKDVENWLEAEQIILMKHKGKARPEKKTQKTALTERVPLELKKTTTGKTKKESPLKEAAPVKKTRKASSTKEV